MLLSSEAPRARDALLFAACYVALDWMSYIHPLGPFNITPWNPQAALGIFWLVLGGPAHAPVVLLSAWLADLLIRSAPGGWHVALVTSLVLTAGYAGMAFLLRRHIGQEVRLRDTRTLAIFAGVVASGIALVSVAYVGILAAAGFDIGSSFAVAAGRFWLGDTVGVLVTAPLLFIAANREDRMRLLGSLRTPEALLQYAAMAGTVAFVFSDTGAEAAKFFYLLFLPLVWTALRGGLPRAAMACAIVQAGVVLGAHGREMSAGSTVELQALVAALSLTALALGVLADEREGALAAMRRSLRLASAGEMAGAIAHEINQPLGALQNYGTVCQLLVQRGDAARTGELEAAIGKMLGESRRASDVVKRLRDFFRSGTMRLERVKATELVASARRIVGQLDPLRHVDFRASQSGDADLLVDRVQIEVVLRNLLSNAIEACSSRALPDRSVSMSTEIRNGRALFKVIDSGPGLSASARRNLFEPFSTEKPAGMGLGLAFSRAIVEMHGGSLSAADSGHGEFHLVLPVHADDI